MTMASGATLIEAQEAPPAPYTCARTSDARTASMMRLGMIVRGQLAAAGVTGPWAAVQWLRNTIYHTQRTPARNTPHHFPWDDPARAYLDTLHDPEIAHLCGGLSLLYIMTLESIGIPARYVGMYTEPLEPMQGHASVEVWHEDRWIASDPSFNVMCMDDWTGEYLSYQEVRERIVARGDSRAPYGFEWIDDPEERLPGHLLQDYPVLINDLLQYMITSGPTIVTDLGRPWQPINQPRVILPASWDGMITRADGVVVPASPEGDIYGYLASGVLR